MRFCYFILSVISVLRTYERLPFLGLFAATRPIRFRLRKKCSQMVTYFVRFRFRLATSTSIRLALENGHFLAKNRVSGSAGLFDALGPHHESDPP